MKQKELNRQLKKYNLTSIDQQDMYLITDKVHEIAYIFNDYCNNDYVINDNTIDIRLKSILIEFAKTNPNNR